MKEMGQSNDGVPFSMNIAAKEEFPSDMFSVSKRDSN
jgi:hypothetical protein